MTFINKYAQVARQNRKEWLQQLQNSLNYEKVFELMGKNNLVKEYEAKIADLETRIKLDEPDADVVIYMDEARALRPDIKKEKVKQKKGVSR
jgi:predicted  nucleic acid-binding Zn-ribbon protein